MAPAATREVASGCPDWVARGGSATRGLSESAEDIGSLTASRAGPATTTRTGYPTQTGAQVSAVRTEAKNRESSIESKCCERALLELSVDSVKIKGVRAFPDRMYLIEGGRPLIIEWKKPNCEPRGNQLLRLYRLYQLGYDIGVCDSVEGGFELIQSCLREAKRRGNTSRPKSTARELLYGDWRRVLGLERSARP